MLKTKRQSYSLRVRNRFNDTAVSNKEFESYLPAAQAMLKPGSDYLRLFTDPLFEAAWKKKFPNAKQGGKEKSDFRLQAFQETKGVVKALRKKHDKECKGHQGRNTDAAYMDAAAEAAEQEEEMDAHDFMEEARAETATWRDETVPDTREETPARVAKRRKTIAISDLEESSDEDDEDAAAETNASSPVGASEQGCCDSSSDSEGEEESEEEEDWSEDGGEDEMGEGEYEMDWFDDGSIGQVQAKFAEVGSRFTEKSVTREATTHQSVVRVTQEKTVRYRVGDHAFISYTTDKDGKDVEASSIIEIKALFEGENGEYMVEGHTVYRQEDLKDGAPYFDPRSKKHAPNGFRDDELVFDCRVAQYAADGLRSKVKVTDRFGSKAKRCVPNIGHAYMYRYGIDSMTRQVLVDCASKFM